MALDHLKSAIRFTNERKRAQYKDCRYTPSEDVAERGLADCPPSVVVLGDSTPPDVPSALPSRFCESVTLIFGSATSDMARKIPCIHLK
jgi:hypothetical protein